MQAFNAFNTIVAHSGKAKETVSCDIGRNRKFIGSITSRGTVPGTVLFAEIADVCGYDLLLRRRDDGSEIVIDPPRRETTD